MVPGESEWDWQGRLPYRLLGDDAADVDQVIGDHAEADPALHSGIALVSAAIETVSPFDHADASLASGAPFLASAEPALPHCQLNLCSAKTSRGRMRDHTAATAFRHWSAASARKTRSVERETRWRWRLKMLWTAGCMLRKRWAERADLNRCILRSRRRTA